MPATIAGASDTISARSLFCPFSEPFPVPRRLISQKTPEALKPFGATTPPATCRNLRFIFFDALPEYRNLQCQTNQSPGRWLAATPISLSFFPLGRFNGFKVVTFCSTSELFVGEVH